MKRLSFFSTKQSDLRRQKKLKFDMHLLITTVALAILGLVVVYDASSVQGFQNFSDKYYYIRQQLTWMVLGFGGLSVFSYVHYRFLKVLALPFFLSAAVLLLMVNVPGLGVAAGGAHRWLKISALTIQPTEIIKLATIIFFAAIFEKGVRTKPFLLILVILSLVIGLLQKDLGSTIVLVLSSVGMYLLAGAPLVYFSVMIPVFLIGFLAVTLGSTYRRQRVLAFLDPFSDPQGFTYHISQVLIALGSGGLLGVGLGGSRQKFAYIPEITTDSIFSLVGEELGFVGGVVLIGLFCFFLYRAFKITEQAPDQFGKLLAAGVTLWLGTQTVVNLAAMVSLIPLTGVPLPFISYGGSALLTNLLGVGVLLSVSRYS